MTKKGMLAIAVAVVVAAGTGTAIAAGTGALSSKPTDNAWVQALAKKLGTTPDKLVEALQGVATDKIDALVADGTITKAQADTLKARVAADGGLGGFGGPGGMGFGGHRGFGGPGGGPLGDPMQAAADYLGLTRDALDTALDGGKTLADEIKAQNKTADGLKAALTAAAKKAIDASTLTDAQKKTLTDGLAARIDAEIASSLGHDGSAPGGFGGRGGFGGPGDHDGFGGRGHHGGLPGFGTGPSVDQLPAPGKGAGFRTTPSVGGTAA